MENVSEYVSSLTGASKKRYECKVTSTGLKVDPYSLSTWTEDPSMIPDVKWSDMMMYMVSTPSPYTRQEIKAWKGMLDGDNFMKSGWVHSLKLHQFAGSNGCSSFVIMGKVKHSQRMSATSLLPWVIVAEKGEVLAAHCTCMAGLGEACSHIAAILSCLIRSAELKQQSGIDSCTSKQCSWLPTARDVTPAAISKIVFKHKDTSSDEGASNVCSPKKPKILPPSEEDINAFYKILYTAKHKPAILKITKPYHEEFIPKLSQSEFPMPITEAYNPETLTMNYPELLKESEKVFESLKATSDQVKKLEEETREQSSVKAWFLHRAGRITASNFKSVCHTNMCMPSQSLIKKICHPEAYKFSTEATRWGCEHEISAIQEYTENAKKNHEGLMISKAGLFVDSEKPYLGASPDGIIECACCGKGSLEVKCPFTCKDKLPDDNNTTFCMVKKDDIWMLKRDHSYYYQVQMQLHVCKLSYGDFVVWSKNGILVERITRDDEFFSGHMDDVKHFFIYAILPEIVGKWYSRKPVADADGLVQIPTTSNESQDNEPHDDHARSWCYCDQPEFGDMIMCDNKNCTIKWFHFDCLRLRRAPKGKWYCPSCAKLPKYNRCKGK